MNYEQKQWATSHDWFHSVSTRTDGNYTVWVHSTRPEGGLTPFTDYNRLRKWAGY